jgi:hypothetical protein
VVAVTGVFRIDEDGVPWVGDRPIRWATSVRDGDGWYGFHVPFENGWQLSVQWGAHMHSSNYDRCFEEAEPESPDAEVAALMPLTEELVHWSDGDTVQGYLSVDDVLRLMVTVSQLPSNGAEVEFLYSPGAYA